MAETVKFDPNTGKPLQAGQTVTFQGKTYTGGSTDIAGTPTKIFTDTNAKEKKPTGIAAITSTLNVGSQGDQVKALQQYLQGLGYKNADGTPLKTDGIYGPQTKAAVMQFQSANGLTADGIFGPKSLAATNGLTSTDKAEGLNTSKFNTGDPGQDSLLSELQNFISSQQAQGLKLNPDLMFTPETLTQFMDAAKSQVHPFYQQQIDTIKQDVAREAPQILQNYQKDIEAQQKDFQDTLGATRENLANQGMAYSGFRGQQEHGLRDKANRNLYDLTQSAGNNLYKLGRAAEEQIGAGNMSNSLGSLGNYSASLSGRGGFTLGGSTNPYQSGGYAIGSTQRAEEADKIKRYQDLLTTAGNAVNAGRTWSDLISK